MVVQHHSSIIIMAINILKSCKSVFAYVKNYSSPSHIRSSIPWRPPLAEILDPRLLIEIYDGTPSSEAAASLSDPRQGRLSGWLDVSRRRVTD